MAKMSDSNHQQDTTVNIYRQYTMLRDIHTLHFQKPRNFDNSMNFIETIGSEGKKREESQEAINCV